jgi:hypothetical protein
MPRCLLPFVQSIHQELQSIPARGAAGPSVLVDALELWELSMRQVVASWVTAVAKEAGLVPIAANSMLPLLQQLQQCST